MSKAPSSVIGLDLGRHTLKAVQLQRRGPDRVALTRYGSYTPAEPAGDAETLGRHLKALFKDLGAGAQPCVVSVSSPEALIRIIEQPETPEATLREALRINGAVLMNQDCRGFVLDCDRVSDQPLQGEHATPGAVPQYKYLVGGLPRAEVDTVSAAFQGAGTPVHSLQLPPICTFNAFELAQPELFADGAFFLVDIGHLASTMIVGARRELHLVRSIDFGGKALLEALAGLSGEGRDAMLQALEQEDEVMVEYTRVSMSTLTREIGSSIGFFEARHDQTVDRIFISGGLARSRTFLKLMGEELGIPCEGWNAADRCENALPPARRAQLAGELLDLNVACGAASGVLLAR